MSNEELEEKLKEINVEDFIWVLYLVIIGLSFYSNHLERIYFTKGGIKNKEKYRKIIILIFFILFFVYLYFFKDGLDSLRKLKKTDSNKKRVLTYLSFIASLFVFISGILLLYVATEDKDLDVEIAFN